MGLTEAKTKFLEYKELSTLLWKHGLIDLRSGIDLEHLTSGVHSNGDIGALNKLHDEKEVVAEVAAKDLVKELAQRGPTYIRIGQLLARRPEMLPKAYCDALTELHSVDKVISYQEITDQIESELKASLHDVFESIEMKPFKVSPFSQFYSARLAGGQIVTVKILKPGIKEEVFQNLKLLEEFANYCDSIGTKYNPISFVNLLSEFKRIILAELDYGQELNNLQTLKANLSHLNKIVFPEPVIHLSTEKVLVMVVPEATIIESSACRGLLKSEKTDLAKQLFYAYLQQILIDGLVHPHPHKDNVLITKNGKIALIDVGAVTNISAELQEKLIQLLQSINERRTSQAASILISMGPVSDNFDKESFILSLEQLILIHRDLEYGELELGKLFVNLSHLAQTHGLTLPCEVSLLGTCFFHLDQIANQLDSEFDSREFVQENVVEIMKEHLIKAFSLGNFFQQFMESSHLLEKLPDRLGKIIDSIADNQLEVSIKTIDEKLLMSGIQKIANRITAGLILAALIIGASMLMNIETSFKLWGYPAIAISCFVIAGGLGMGLVLEVLISDWFDSRRTK